MCGVVGELSNAPDVSWMDSAICDLRRRGPDSAGKVVIDSKVVMGATRLAMVDSHSRSNQPMQIDQLVISFNGEIYNYRELSKTYLKEVFLETESDTEILSRLYRLLGPEAFLSFNGMWATAIFDKSESSLTLARDPGGKKPLYMINEGDSLRYSSSFLSLARTISKPVLNKVSLVNYLHLGFVSIRNLPIDGITQVMPGEVIDYRIEDSIVLSSDKKESDKNVSKRLKVERGKRSLNKDIREAVMQSVELRTRGYDHVALLLSGGIDSTIVGLVLRELQKEVSAYSLKWEETDKDRYNYDASRAYEISKLMGFNFKLVNSFPILKLSEVTNEYLIAMEEPNCNPTGLSALSLFSAIKEDGLRIALGGDGGDEIFAGYPRYRKIARLQHLDFLFRLTKHSNFERFRKFNTGEFESWSDWHDVFSFKEIQNLLAPEYSGATNDLMSRYNALHSSGYDGTSPERETKTSAVEHCMNWDKRIWLAHESNTRLDKISMYHSVELRSPFQDLFLDGLMKEIRERFGPGLDKAHLKSAFPELEQFPTLEKKSGFISPVGHWMRSNLELIDDDISKLSERKILLEKWNTQKILNSGNYRLIRQTWSLYIMSRWLQKLIWRVGA